MTRARKGSPPDIPLIEAMLDGESGFSFWREQLRRSLLPDPHSPHTLAHYTALSRNLSSPPPLRLPV